MCIVGTVLDTQPAVWNQFVDELGAPGVVATAGQAEPVLLGSPPRWRAIFRSSSEG